MCNQWKGISTLGQKHHGTREKHNVSFLTFSWKKMSNYIHLLTSLSGYNCSELSGLFGIGKCFVLYRFLVSIRYSPSRDSRRFVQFFSFFFGVYPRRETALWENNNKSYMYNSISILICKSITLFWNANDSIDDNMRTADATLLLLFFFFDFFYCSTFIV